MAIETLSTVLATDFKATEIEIGLSSTSPDEVADAKGLAPGRWRTMDEGEVNDWLVRVGEKD
jgi:20S proteasome subunit alpha 1